MADTGGYTFGDSGTTGSSSPTGVAPGTTYTPGADTSRLFIEVASDGRVGFVNLTAEELQQALGQGRHVYEPTSSQVLQLVQEGRLNPETLPPEVRAELGRLQHADPSVGPLFQTAALPGDAGAGAAGTGGPLDLGNLTLASTDPVLKDATDWYYTLYGVVPPQGFIEGLKERYENIYDIKQAILQQARQDKAPGLSSLPAGALSPEMQRLSPLIDAAGRYYFELYGRPAPKGQIENMARSGMSLFGIQHELLTGAKQAGAPGYADVRFSQEVASANQLYFSLWGRDAPPRYAERAITDGLGGTGPMNLFELEKFERSKPAFMETKRARDELTGAAGQLTQFLGMGY